MRSLYNKVRAAEPPRRTKNGTLGFPRRHEGREGLGTSPLGPAGLSTVPIPRVSVFFGKPARREDDGREGAVSGRLARRATGVNPSGFARIGGFAGKRGLSISSEVLSVLPRLVNQPISQSANQLNFQFPF